jgi:hypothetical protein
MSIVVLVLRALQVPGGAVRAKSSTRTGVLYSSY